MKRTHLYELKDAGTNTAETESMWGLYRHDGTPKPSAIAMKNLMRLTRDGSGNFEPGKLDVRLEGGSPGLRQVLLQKSSGEFLLVLWKDVKNYDLAQKREMNQDPDQVRLVFGAPLSEAKWYLPVDGEGLVGAETNTSAFDVTVPEHPLVIVLRR